MNLTVVYITNRNQPHTEWLLDSFAGQCHADEWPEVIVVAPEHSQALLRRDVMRVRPKPTIWSGPHRITKAEHWSASNARNTGICYATQEHIAFIDDRSVLLPGWLEHARAAMGGKYCVCGSYEKVDNLVVNNGKVVSFKPRQGRDSRLDYCDTYYGKNAAQYGNAGLTPPYSCPGEWTYGCSIVLPLEWVLKVGGFDETCDGLGMEDCIFGMMLQNNGCNIYFEPRMKMLEDRTPGCCDPVAIRRDKGVSPNDKSHALLARLRAQKRALLPGNLRDIRNEVLAGKPFPPCNTPAFDWYDNSPITGLE